MRGKIKTFLNYPKGELDKKGFYNIINRWDSTIIDDENNPNQQYTFVPIQITSTVDDIAQIRFEEKIEFDTVSCTLTKEVNVLKFIKQERNEVGENVGLKKLFDAKLNN